MSFSLGIGIFYARVLSQLHAQLDEQLDAEGFKLDTTMSGRGVEFLPSWLVTLISTWLGHGSTRSEGHWLGFCPLSCSSLPTWAAS